MTDAQFAPTSETEGKILDAAIRTFLRFGARKTSMSDIAAAAGVSRQTLYDLFGGKDDLIRASTRAITDQKLSAVRRRIRDDMPLSEKLDAYFAETLIASFEALQAAGDAEDLIAGYHEAGKDEIARSHEQHMDLLEEALSPYAAALAKHGLTPRQQARFIVTVTAVQKTSAATRDEIDRLLETLKANCLAVTGA